MMKVLMSLAVIFAFSGCAESESYRKAQESSRLLEAVQKASHELHERVIEFNRRCYSDPIVTMPCQLANDHLDTGWLHAWFSGDEHFEVPKNASLQAAKDGQVYWVWESK